VARVRALDANPNLFEHFEWLAATMVRLHPELAFNPELFERTLADRLAASEADQHALEAMRMPAESRPRVRTEKGHR
jgi:hypothetical protein